MVKRCSAEFRTSLQTVTDFFTQNFQSFGNCLVSRLLSTCAFKMFMITVTTSSWCSDSITLSHLIQNSWLKAAAAEFGLFGFWAEMQHSCSSVQGFIMTLSKHPSADVCVCVSVCWCAPVCVCLIVLVRKETSLWRSDVNVCVSHVYCCDVPLVC